MSAFRRDEAGQSVVLIAVALPLILGLLLLVIDGGRLYVERERIRNAAQLAAEAAVSLAADQPGRSQPRDAEIRGIIADALSRNLPGETYTYDVTMPFRADIATFNLKVRVSKRFTSSIGRIGFDIGADAAAKLSQAAAAPQAAGAPAALAPPAAATFTAHFNDARAFSAAAGTVPAVIDFDRIVPGTDIGGSTFSGVTFRPRGSRLLVVRGSDTVTDPAEFWFGCPPTNVATNKLLATSGALVLSPGGTRLAAGAPGATAARPVSPADAALLQNDDLELVFAPPVSAVGFDLLYQALDGNSYVGITVYGRQGETLFARSPIPATNRVRSGGAEFVGFTSSAANIARIVIDEHDDDNICPDSNVGFDTFRVVGPATSGRP